MPAWRPCDYAVLTSTATALLSATFVNASSSTPFFKTAVVLAGSTSAGSVSSRQNWFERISESKVCSFFSSSAAFSDSPLMTSRRGSTLTLISFAVKPGTSARTVIWFSASLISTGTRRISSDSARNQSSRSWPNSRPRASKYSYARRATDCVKTHTRGGLVQLFLANDSENRRHSGCSIAAQDVHQNGGKEDGRKRPNEDSDRL